MDTKNANYSYGSLQKILEIGLTNVGLQSVENLLLLGMGGGSVIKSLRETFEYKNNIVAVEIDPEVIRLAKNEFGISASEKLQIVQEDAFEYVKTFNSSAGTEEKFQLIIIDLFIDLNVPPVFFEKEFCQNVSSLLQKNGFIIFNVGVNLDKNSDVVEKLIANLGNDFDFKTLTKVNGTNTLLIAQRINI
ncbi:spermidine synthase [Aequorivita marina]|uniref:spermidine synthase n=1 Tax=Aequorivita marina TaxID=3073654 RepID=UPI002874EDAC|nr:fused MFS/spermidine synthase [Aequorivita sp. S2608]MDS1298111.1 fused MFS/spermidine synthase [Aequorivita sp. S2608]